jgi:hypothetical protein
VRCRVGWLEPDVFPHCRREKDYASRQAARPAGRQQQRGADRPWIAIQAERCASCSRRTDCPSPRPEGPCLHKRLPFVEAIPLRYGLRRFGRDDGVDPAATQGPRYTRNPASLAASSFRILCEVSRMAGLAA